VSGVGRRVVLVRGWDRSTGGAGCCPPAYGAAVLSPPHEHGAGPPTAGAQRSADVYRALRERFPRLDVTVVDSGNWAWLGPAVYRDARRSGRGRLASLREAARATTPGCLVVDGEVVLDGRPPTPTEAVAEVVRRTPVTTSTG
jgi:hypothetical protein